MLFKRYRYRIYPTKVQAAQLAQHFGAVRYVYNWGLATKNKAWSESKERLTKNDLINQVVLLKKELTWLNDPFSQSLQIALQNLDSAFANFFAGRKDYPVFKKRSSRQSFAYPQNPSPRSLPFVRFGQSVIHVPKIGLVKCVFKRRYEGKLKSITIIKTPTGKYFASCLVEVDQELPEKFAPCESQAIGVDLGIKTFAVLSDGETVANPRFLDKSQKALRRARRKHSKKKKGSKNREKARLKLVRLYEKVTNQRTDFLHKTTTKLIRENQTICIEDLNVVGMGKLHNLARHIKDASWGAFRQMLTYKAEWQGKNLLVINRFAPSSRQCTCGVKNTELKLKQRSWTCASCGTTHDRDLLAAQNIVRFAFHPETISK